MPKYDHAGSRNGVIRCQMALWSGPGAAPTPRSPASCTCGIQWPALGPTLNAPFDASKWLPGALLAGLAWAGPAWVPVRVGPEGRPRGSRGVETMGIVISQPIPLCLHGATLGPESVLHGAKLHSGAIPPYMYMDMGVCVFACLYVCVCISIIGYYTTS